MGLMDSVSVEDVIKAHKNYYEEIHRSWLPHEKPAVLSFKVLTEEEYYQPGVQGAPSYIFGDGKDQIYIPLMDHGIEKGQFYETRDCQELRILNVENKYDIPEWKQAIIEEACHRVEKRFLGGVPDDMGIYISAHYGVLNTPANQHKPAFSSAVAKYALHFGLDLHKLIRTLFNKKTEPPPNGVWEAYVEGHIVADSELRPIAYSFFDDRNTRLGHVEHGHDREDWHLARKKATLERRVALPAEYVRTP
jgi:hypothetical protein